MVPFVLRKLPQIYFGPGKIAALPQLIAEKGQRVLMITGAFSFCRSTHWNNLTDSLKKQGVKIFHASVCGEPSPELVDGIVLDMKSKKPDLVVSIGGGSVIDAGKAVSAMLPKEDSVLNYLEGGRGATSHDGVKIPFIAVPTTSGTGSEATKNAVLSRVGPDGFKRSIRHDYLIPDIAVVDPELMVSCPPAVTAACGMDAFVQLLESYVSSQANAWTDALAWSGLSHAADGLIAAYQDGSNISARSKMAYGALMSGITLAHAGLGVVHGFASVLGGFFSIPHGVICGTLVGAAVRINIAELKQQDPTHTALEKYAKVGFLIGKKNHTCLDPLDRLVQTLDHWIDILQLPPLGSFGVRIHHLDQVVMRTENKNNPVKLSPLSLRAILSSRI